MSRPWPPGDTNFQRIFGQWTPVIGGQGGTSGQTYSTQAGAFAKYGQLVIAEFTAILSNKGTITGIVTIEGFPYPVSTQASIFGIADMVFVALATNWISVKAATQPGQSRAVCVGIQAAGTTNGNTLTTADITNTTQLSGTLIYFTDF